MGVTIHYRGRLADLTRVEDFEDRLLDLALEIGGLGQIWRSHADDQPERMVRGVILNLAPGQESTSLLVSPEGWLIGLVDIEDAEQGRLTEPPWCFVKTQFGPLEGHVALVEVLAALRREFVPDLEVSDEGGYWETHDLAELARRRGTVQQAIEGLAEGLRRHGLSQEAAEDPAILLRHIERVAAQVHRILERPAEHPPVTFPEESEAGAGGPDPETTEALWDEMFKHNRRQQERLQRALEERRSHGEDDEEALDKAFDDLALNVPDEVEDSEEEAWDDDEELFEAALSSESTAEAADSEREPATDSPFPPRDEERHPLLKRAMDLLAQLHTVFRDADKRLEPSLRTLFHGAGDVMGGLAQALPDYGDGADDVDMYGLRITQLKRALRGAAFARGALCSLRSAVTAEQFQDLARTLAELEKDVFQECSRLRAEHRPDES
jgi:hypothetical protein